MYADTQQAMTEWKAKVSESVNDAQRTTGAVHDVQRQVDWLIDTIQGMKDTRFPHDMEDYEVLEKARNLHDIVARTMQNIDAKLLQISNEIFDLRRAVEFFHH